MSANVYIMRFLTLFFQDMYSDATIVCHGKYYPVHRFVLSTCSDYFEEIFEKIECKHPFIIVKDVKVCELEALLRYMYLGEVNVLQDALPSLIKAAESLRVKGLAVPDESSFVSQNEDVDEIVQTSIDSGANEKDDMKETSEENELMQSNNNNDQTDVVRL